jgi:hypothetical protein
MLDEQGMRVLLHEDPPGGMPDSLVDLGRVFADGRQRRRRRQLLVTGGAGVLALAVVAGLGVTLQLLPPPVSAPAVRPRASTPPARVKVDGFDPLLYLRIAPGWLPDGAQPVARPEVTAASQSISYSVGEGDTPQSTDLTITLYAPGFKPFFLGPKTENQLDFSTSPADPVGSAPAQSYTIETHYKPGEPHTRPILNGIVWQYEPGAYATVGGQAPGTVEQNQAIWRHIAQQVRFNGSTPVPVDVTVSHVPPSIALISASHDTRPEVTTMLVFNDESYILGAGRLDGVSVAALPTFPLTDNGAVNTKDGRPATAPEVRQVDGHQVYVLASGNHFSVAMVYDSAHNIVVAAQGRDGGAAPISIDDAIAMLVSVRLIPNQADWTTDPVRD